MSDVLIEVHDRIGRVTLNRPEALNAWTLRMRAQIAETIQSFGQDPAVDAVIVTGAGEGAFCAGQDTHETATFAVSQVEEWLDSFKHVYDAVLSAPKPVVAALNGLTAGSGYEFALVCDFRVAHADVRIGQPEVKSGIPSITGQCLTHYSLGHSRAAEMVLSGRMLLAEDAARVGLVQYLTEAAHVMEASTEWAHDLAARPKLAFRLTKQRMRDVLWPRLLEAFEVGREMHGQAWTSGEPQQAARQVLAARGSTT